MDQKFLIFLSVLAFSNSENEVPSTVIGVPEDDKVSSAIPQVKHGTRIDLGDSRSNKLGIIGGVTTNITDHPYQLSIDNGDTFVCSGALLNRNWAVALASCTAGADPADLVIRLGSNSDVFGGTRINITEIVIHPNYTYSTMDYDFALLKLSTYICFDANTASIEFATKKPPASAQGTISGWGRERDFKSGKFQQLSMRITSNTACQNKYSKTNDVITGRMFCASAGSKGPCYNDFGDPLVVNGTLYGLYSWSRDCANPEFPAVFSNLASVQGWIYSVLENSCVCGVF